MRREALGVGVWLGVDLWSDQQAHVCIAEMEKGDVADGYREDDGVGWRKGR